MSLRRTLQLAACLGPALLFVAAAGAQSLRAPSPDSKHGFFIITDQEGYGTGECLERQGGCGQVIADSFCESKGFRAAQFYRRASLDDVTGSLSQSRSAPQREPQGFVIGCR